MADGPTLLRLLVVERHWQQFDSFRIQYERAAQELASREHDPRLRTLTISKRQFERWYGGELKSRPYPLQCRVLEAMFGVPVDALLAPASVSVSTAPPPQAPRFTLPQAPADVGEFERQVVMAARRTLRFTTSIEDGSVGGETVAHIHDEVSRLSREYPRAALPSILGDLIDVQDLTFRLLEDRRPSPSQARDLYVLAGVSCCLLAKASQDAGDFRSSMMQARTAYMCADRAGHGALRAWVRGQQSLASYWAERYEDAAHYASLGRAACPGGSGTVGVWLAALDARVRARMGDTVGSYSALDGAREAREALRPDDLDALGGLLTFALPRQLYYMSETALLLGDDPVLAEEQADRAVAGYRDAPAHEWAFHDEACSHTNLALARIERGALDGAADAIRPVLDLPSAQRNNAIVASAKRVHDALGDSRLRGSSQALDLRAEIEAFTPYTPLFP